MKFEIPPLIWVVQSELCFNGHRRQTYLSQNTFIEYAIQSENGLFYCYYGNGRFREFASLMQAKEWVETVHYPDQVKKYFKEVK